MENSHKFNNQRVSQLIKYLVNETKFDCDSFGIPGVIFKDRVLKFDTVGPLSMFLSVSLNDKYFYFARGTFKFCYSNINVIREACPHNNWRFVCKDEEYPCDMTAWFSLQYITTCDWIIDILANVDIHFFICVSNGLKFMWNVPVTPPQRNSTIPGRTFTSMPNGIVEVQKKCCLGGHFPTSTFAPWQVPFNNCIFFPNSHWLV